MDNIYTKHVNYLFESIQTESEVKESEGKSIIHSILNELKIGMQLVFIFGAGIGSFIGPVTDILANEGFSMSKEEVGTLLVAAFATLLRESPEQIAKIKEVLKEKDLLKHLDFVTDFINKSKKLVSVVAEKTGRVVKGISDILGFTFLLVPTMKMVGEVINDAHVTSGSLSEFITGLSIAVGVYGFKTVLGKVLDKKDDKPYEEKVEEGYHIRTFSEDTNEDELVWHRDKEDRIVESIGNTDWMIQLDNEIPKTLTEKVSIPKNTYHRVIKGSGDLKVRIKKSFLNESDAESEKHNICDELTANTVGEIKSLLNKMKSDDKYSKEINKLIKRLNKDVDRLSSDKDVVNTYLRMIQNIVCK